MRKLYGLFAGLLLAVPFALGQTTSTDRLQGLTASVAVKAPVKVASAANLTLEGEQTVNGVAVVEGDRVLVKDQSDATENGIYVVSTGDWSRAGDFDGQLDVVKGTLVVTNNSTSIYYRVTTADPITIDTSSITFEAVAGAVSAGSVGLMLNPRSAAEIAASVTPSDYSYRYGEAPRYASLADAVAASKGPTYKLALDASTRAITAALAVDEPLIVEGMGSNSAASAGSIIDNGTNDVTVFDVNGDAQRTVFRDFGVIHEAATQPAFRFLEGAAYGQFDNVVVNCNSAGYGGVLLGDEDAETQAELDAVDAEAWQATTQNLRIDDCTGYNLRINSTGHTWELGNSSLRTSVDNAISLYVNAPNTFVRGGQIGASGTGGKPMYWYNLRGGLLRGGGAEGQKFENVGASKYAIEVDGATQPWESLIFSRIGGNFTNGITGTMIKFGRCDYCWLIYPEVETPTGGGTLAEWGENSVDCGVLVDYNAARAPVTVHASATRPVKVVYGQIPAADVTNITTNANLKVILRDGIPELPAGFVPVHNGTAWNYGIATIADDAATNFTVPVPPGASIKRSRVTVMVNGGVTFSGAAFVDVDAGGAAISAQGVGADFNTTTGVLAGTTGTDAKVTLSAHTTGVVYVENRSGASIKVTVLFQPVGNL